MSIEQPIGYASLEERKAVGAHYTPRALADFVARKMLEFWKPASDVKSVRLLDPAVGDGELLLSALGEIYRAGFSEVQCIGFDTDRQAIDRASTRISAAYPRVSLDLREEDFLEFALTYGKGRLFSYGFEHFDLAIANPPYVRTQVMGAGKAQQITRQFDLSGRVDLYYAFLSGIGMLMKPEGIAGIIVSNRFMVTKSGRSIRKDMLNKFDILHIWDLGDTQLFEAAVLPSVLLVKGKGRMQASHSVRFTSMYSTEPDGHAVECEGVIDALDEHGIVKLSSGRHYFVQQGQLAYGDGPGGVWRVATQETEAWLATVAANTGCTFGDVGEVKVGIKTTADSVFIRSDWDDLPEDEQPEVLRPLLTHHVARRFRAKDTDHPKKVLYTHQVRQGKRVPIDLEKFPHTARYLKHYRAQLESREYVLDAGREWFEIWVPHDPAIWSKPKVVFRDISEKPTFWMDLSGSVVNGDCYWITCKNSQSRDLLWLILSVGNSSFIETFYDYKFGNKLYSGRRRFMTQYVRQFPLPDLESGLTGQIIDLARTLYEAIPSGKANKLEVVLDRLVWQAFGFSN